MTSLICNFCSSSFNSHSALNYHKETAKYCLKIQEKDLKNNDHYQYKCEKCYKTFLSSRHLDRHLDTCSIKVLEEINVKESELTRYKILLEIKEKEFENYKIEKEKQIKKLEYMIEKANTTIAEIAKQPKTINTTVRGDQNVQNILSDYSTYKEYTSYDRIISIAKEDKDFDKYFEKGQEGIAQFVCDRIVNTDDGKMIICCTDPNRKRFKYHSKKNGITDDIEARRFTKKISKPIKDVCEIVHNNIQRDLETLLVDKLEKSQIEYRKNWSYEKLSEISQFDDNKRNSKYRKELCILLSHKSPEENDINDIDDIDDIEEETDEENEEKGDE